MKAHLAILISWFSFTYGQPGIELVRLGTLDIEMRSGSRSEPAELVTNVLAPVVAFLTDVYKNEYRNFEQLRFIVNSVNIASDGLGGFTAALSVKGTLSFDDNMQVDVPTPSHISESTSQAFNVHDQQFLDNISMISRNPFLRDISYALVTVNGEAASFVGFETGLDTRSNSQAEHEPEIEIWAIAVASAASILVLLLCVFIAWLFFTSAKEEEERTAETAPITSKGTAPASESICESISPTPSMTSQDSSKFTYNPSSVRGSRYSTSMFGTETQREDETELPTSTNTGFTRWKREARSQLPTREDDVSISFGQDISDIQNVTEGDGEEPAHQTKSLLSVPKIAARRSERRVLHSLLDHSENSSLNDTGGSSSDVIQELNDLSSQISKLRTVPVPGNR